MISWLEVFTLALSILTVKGSKPFTLRFVAEREERRAIGRWVEGSDSSFHLGVQGLGFRGVRFLSGL